MATSVQIELLVDEKGAVSGVRAFDTAVKGSTGSVRQLSQEMGVVGARAEAGARQPAAAMKQTQMATREALHESHLFTEEIGIHMPRAFQRLVSQSRLAQTALGAIAPIMTGIAAIEIGGMVLEPLIEGAKKVWEHFHLVEQAARDYQAEIEKTANQEFGNPDSIETTRLRIVQATDDVKEFKRQMDAAQGAAPTHLSMDGPAGAIWDAWNRASNAGDAANSAFAKQRQLDELNRKKLEQDHKEKLSDLELNHAKDDLKPDADRIDAQKKYKYAVAYENTNYNDKLAGTYGNPVADDNGMAAENHATQMADAEAAVKLAELKKEQASKDKQTAAELRRIHEEAVESSLSGVALYKQQESAAIEELKQKGIASAGAVADIKEKFHSEEMKWLGQEAKKTGEAADAWDRANVEAQASFARRANEIERQGAERGLSGFPEIRAKAQSEMLALEQEFKDHGGNPADLTRGKIAIGQNADKETAALTERNTQQTLEIEEQARVRSLSAEKQKTAAIQSEYEKRLQLYREELTKQEISEDDFNRRVQAAAEERDAEMVEASREAHAKMASEFDSLFKSLNHPLKALENLGDKVAGNAAASLVQYIQGRGHNDPNAPQGGILGTITSFGKKIPGLGADRHAAAQHEARAVAQASFSISQAVIHVGSVSFAGGGGGGGSFSSGGGTSLLSPGGGGSLWSGGTIDGTGFASPRSTYGGAGDFSGTASDMPSFAGGGPMVAAHKGAGSILGDLTQGVGIAKQFGSIFGKKGGSGASGGSASGGGASSSLGSGVDAAMGGATGALGVYSAVKGDGGLGGALGGAMSGMQLGMALGGPLGAAIGAGAGAVVGAIGFGGKEKARVYDLKQVRPKLVADQDAYAEGTMDYMSAYSDVQGMIGSSWGAIRSMGPAAMKYWQSTIKPELEQAMGKFTSEQRAGRSNYSAQGASYDIGTDYVPGTGMALVHKGERVTPSDQNERITRAMESGADLSSVHASYTRAMRTGSARGNSGGDRTLNMHVHTIDAAGVDQFFGKYKHQMRSHLNDSYAENSGGGL